MNSPFSVPEKMSNPTAKRIRNCAVGIDDTFEIVVCDHCSDCIIFDLKSSAFNFSKKYYFTAQFLNFIWIRAMCPPSIYCL